MGAVGDSVLAKYWLLCSYLLWDVEFGLIAAGSWLFAIGIGWWPFNMCVRIALGYQLLAAGCWLLVTRCLLLVT